MSQLNSFQVSFLNLLVSESIPPLTAYPLAFFRASILVKEFGNQNMEEVTLKNS